RQHRCQKGRARREKHEPGRPVEPGHQVDEPEVIAAVDEEQQEQRGTNQAVRRDQQRSFADAVDDESRQRREEGGQHEDEEGETGRGIAARKGLGPDPEDEEHRRVAQHRDGRAEQEDARVADTQEPAHPTCGGGTAAASASARSTSSGSSSSGSGISRTERTGESSTGRKGTQQPAPLTIRVVLSPINDARTPPAKDPRGIVPQTMKRMTEFIRPWMRSGVIACRRLTCAMLYVTFANPPTNIAGTSTVRAACPWGANGIARNIGPPMTEAAM